MNAQRILLLLLFLLPNILLTAQIDYKILDQYLAKAQQDWDIPGMAIGIIENGEVKLAKGYGHLKSGTETTVDGNSIFAIASNTKAFISAAIGILVDEGKLKWDDPVQQYLPYFELYAPYVSANITVRDLLCHRAGLGTFSGDVIWYKSNYSAEEVVKRAAKVPQDYGFRSGYGYSNLMFITAGEVIEAVSGQPWHEFIKKHIFQPLDMARTRTSVEDLKKMTNVAQPHKPTDGKNRPIPYVNWDNMGAAGGILSSVNDMLKWVQLQIDGGKTGDQQIFSARAQETFWQPHNNFRVSSGTKEYFPTRHVSGYALGWSYFDHGGQMVYNHGGGYDGMYSKVVVVPEAKLGIVILTNSMKGISNPLTYHILDQAFNLEPKDWNKQGLEGEERGAAFRKKRIDDRIASRLPDTKPTLELPAYAGKYSDDMFGTIEVNHTEKGLELHFPSAPSLDATLEHWHLNTFEIKWKEVHAWFDFGTLQFVLDNNGKVQSLQFDVPNDDIFFEEIHAKRTE